jgi:hypothetical protein
VCGVTRDLLWRGLGIDPPEVRNFFFPGLRSDTFWTGWYTVGGIENCGYKELNYFTPSTCRI